jgi:hypothetical protein
MRLVQFFLPGNGRRIGQIEGKNILDLTSINAKWTHLYHLFYEANRNKKAIATYLDGFPLRNSVTLPYEQLLETRPGDENGWILPPLDHPDPAHCMISGTGLTHLGSMEQRVKMHTLAKESSKTDSQKMFEMGLARGKPEFGLRGIQPEWFYKGTGAVLRGHRDFLDIPEFTEDGGEEPEIVGCYLIDDEGNPCRVGFAIGNEWSDHSVEKMNYLWLASSKLRTCSVGPELITDQSFKDIRGRCLFSGRNKRSMTRVNS